MITTALNIKNCNIDKSTDKLSKCFENLKILKLKCNELKECCPYNCINLKNKLKFNEIINELKEEQRLCEIRHKRIKNGL